MARDRDLAEFSATKDFTQYETGSKVTKEVPEEAKQEEVKTELGEVEEEKELTPSELIAKRVQELKEPKEGTVESRSKRTTFLLDLKLKERMDVVTKVSSATKQEIINSAIESALEIWEEGLKTQIEEYHKEQNRKQKTRANK